MTIDRNILVEKERKKNTLEEQSKENRRSGNERKKTL